MRVPVWLAVLVGVFSAMNPSVSAKTDELHHQATAYLRQYLRVDTSNPPGDVRDAVKFLSELLRAEGIGYQVFVADESAGKVNLLARLKGTGKAKPILMINHIDVVPVEIDKWSVDPFSGMLKDGAIWGRGALDMKGMGIAELMTLIRLKREGVALDRDVLWLAVCDEEIGGQMGARWMVDHHYAEMDPEYVLDEGGGGTQGLFTTDGRVVFAPSVNEKSIVWLRLSVRGEGGHGSMPTPDNPPEILQQALARLVAAKPDLERAEGHPVVELLRTRLGTLAENRYTNAITKHTITITSIQSAVGDPPKVNVIPSEASATLDCRLLPGADTSAFIARVKQALGDPRVQVDIEYQPTERAETSSHDTPLFRAIEAAVKAKFPEAVVVPQLLPGGTDSRFFRMKGAVAYGFEPMVLKAEELGQIHGHDERIAVDQFHQMIDILYDVITRVAQAAPGPR